ncbi:MAG TPA: HD domain-containing phosphohydrolase [Pirellulales bacterium]|nr:HD domain-containing phosphohydrolase [Pirellulales bacterium]
MTFFWIEIGHMRRLITYIGVGIVAQVACVALGLWMHDHFLLLAAGRSAEDRAVDALSLVAGPLLAVSRPLDLSSDAALAAVQKQCAKSHLAAGDGVLMVGPNWRVRSAFSAVGETALAPGDAVAWTTDSFSAPETRVDRVQGTFPTPRGPQFALAYRLPKEAGTLIVCRAAENVLMSPADFHSAAPLVGLMTFLWLSGLLSICTFMAGKRLSDELTDELQKSEERAVRREQALLRTRDAVIFGLAKLAESRDSDTGEHVERIALYCQRLSAALRRRPEYREAITPGFVRLIESSSVLHDIGKVGIADAILHKPGPLTADERQEVQKHAAIGGECLAEIERRLGASNFLQMAREIALCHHERWDGNGYPNGIGGEAIPLAARIVAIADNYDALVSRRPYKEPFPHDKVVHMIRNGAGKQFDPRLVEVFLEIEEEFRAIAEQYAAAARLSLRVATPAGEEHNEPSSPRLLAAAPA